MQHQHKNLRLFPGTAPIALLAIIAVLFLSHTINAQTTLLNFRAQLPNEVTPATGVFEMEFRLFDAAASGNQIGATNVVDTVHVKVREFTVSLDYGAEAFPGADRYIEISYRRHADEPFTTIVSRVPVLSVPYAIRALNATTADNINGVDFSSFVQTNDARLSDSRVPSSGSNNYIQNTTTQQAPADFNISGNGSADILNAATQYNIGGSRVLSNAGTNNIFAGVGAGAANTGSENAFFGRNAGNSNTTGGRNSFFGNTAGSRNTTGGGNSIFGAFAGFFNSQGNGNAFFGSFAGNSNTAGSNNAFFGTAAGLGNTTAGGNSFFGTQSGLRNTTGKDNAFFGQRSGEQNLTADGNSFFGNDSGATNTTGAGNSFFGLGAGYRNLGGSNNVFLGRGAGDFNISGSNNTVIGANADLGVDNLNFAAAIGAGAIVSTSNTIVLGRSADTVKIPGLLSVSGIILKSPSGACFELRVTDTGAVITSTAVCP